jgi:hypothetical protein
LVELLPDDEEEEEEEDELPDDLEGWLLLLLLLSEPRKISRNVFPASVETVLFVEGVL